MPYIKKEDKLPLYFTTRKKDDDAVTTNYLDNPGKLNYLLTLICIDYFKSNGRRYQQINDIVGALEGCKLEFYRRLAAPYEDKKIVENGDVY